MQLAIIALCLGVALCAQNPSDEVWNAWKLKYGKVYETTVEDTIRRNIFNAGFEQVSLHNVEASLGIHRYTREMNHFADLTSAEYQSLLMPVSIFETQPQEETVEDLGTPSTQNWLNQGKVTAVKNQEQCGSCWAFSTTGSVEGAWSMQNTLVSLSEQQLVSCDPYDSGCNGGWYYNAFYYLIHNGGSISEAAYPYTSGNGYVAACASAGKPASATISTYKCTTSGSESALENAVGNKGPVSVAIDASLASFSSYKSGIYSSPQCSSSYLDHAVLAIGYNQDSQGEYWIVKNSWGTSWGQAGYIWMAKNDNNMCGIASQPCYPIV